MTEIVKRIEYYYAEVEDRPGEGRKLLEFLSAHGVNLTAFTAFPLEGRKAQLDFVPENAEKLKEAVAEINMERSDYLKLRMIKGGAEVRVDKDLFTENLFVLSKYFDVYLAWDELDKFQYLDVRFDGQLIIKNKES